MRARYYNPDIRRFVNQDVILGSITNSQSLNRYAYCQGNPVNSLDPFGLLPTMIFGTGGHGLLNLLGLIPGGDIFDLANAIWYFTEGKVGEGFAAGISALPLVGNFIGNRVKAGGALIKAYARLLSHSGTLCLGFGGSIEAIKNLNAMYSQGGYTKAQYGLGWLSLGLNVASCIGSTIGVTADVSSISKLQREMNIQANVAASNDNYVGPGNENFIGPLTDGDHHLIYGDGIGPKKKGVLGAHNKNHFYATLESTGYSVDELLIGEPIEHPSVKGIYSQKYRVPAHDGRGTFIGYKNADSPKTYFDPNIISDEQMIRWAKEAMQNGKVDGCSFNGSATNGLIFRYNMQQNGQWRYYPYFE